MERKLRRLGLFAFVAVGVFFWMVACFYPSEVSPESDCKIFNDKQCSPILLLEASRNGKDVQKALGEVTKPFNSEGRKQIRRNTKADFVFIVAYTSFFVFMMWVLVSEAPIAICVLAILVPFIAGVSDFVENWQLLKIVTLDRHAAISPQHFNILSIAYYTKWGLIFALTGLVSMFFSRARKNIRPLGLFYVLIAVVGFAGLFQLRLIALANSLMALGIINAAIFFTLFPEVFVQEPVRPKQDSEGASSASQASGNSQIPLEMEEEETSVGPEDQFEEEFKETVFQAELQEIGIRQEKAKGTSKYFSRPDLKLTSPPSADLGLVGLALSGGGIRSATFCLGAIQALAKNGLFQQVDYLSTVSGGGYIGSCLSAMLKKGSEKMKWEKFPFRHICGHKEPEEVRQLRNSGNYVAPDGFIDRLRLAALLVRGIFLHFAVLLPYLIGAAALTYFIHSDWLFDVARRPVENWKDYYCFTPWTIYIFLFWALLFPLFHMITKGNIESRNRYERTFAALLLVTIVMTALESILPFFVWIQNLKGLNLSALMGNLGAAFSAASFLFTEKTTSKRGKLAFTIGIYGVAVIGPLILLLLYFQILSFFVMGNTTGAGHWIFLLTLLLFLFTRRFIDINAISMHGFYRDRLSKAYLFRIDGNNHVVSNDKITLPCLKDPNSAAPYHLINAAINLQGSKDVNLRGRMSDFFFFSKHYCGGLRTGFEETKKLMQLDPHLDLGTAMAISGAAASANMGSLTIRPLVFLLTLLNVRLGYWLPNPLRVKTKSLQINSKLGVGPFYFMKELLGMVNEKSNYINASDGGHLENLGIYELLRRKCKYIIAIDAEADRDMSFGSLAKLIRYARIDLSYDIDIDLQDVKLHEDGYSRKHCALGKIYYKEGETGYLLYIKASLTGDENEYIQEYAKAFSSFPHQSTADQFFDEAQFEVYRALGYHITAELFEERFAEKEIEARLMDKPLQPLEEWFEELYLALKPGFGTEETLECCLITELNSLESQLGKPQQSRYLSQNFPEIDLKITNQKSSTTNPDFNQTFAICRQQLRVMQEMFIRLRLDQLRRREHYSNRGWMNLFRRWAQSPDFRRTWAMTIGTFSLGFQRFCEEALKIHLGVVWNLVEPADYASQLTQRELYYLKMESLSGGPELTAWVADMIVNLEAGNEGFGTKPIKIDPAIEQLVIRIGFAMTKHEKGKVVLWGYRLRDFYRQMRLTDETIPVLWNALKDKYHSQTVTVRLTEEEARLYGAFFRRHGYEIEEIRKNKKRT